MQWVYVVGAGSGAVGGSVRFMGSNQNIRRRKRKKRKTVQQLIYRQQGSFISQELSNTL